MSDIVRRIRRRASAGGKDPKLSFGTWDDLPEETNVVQICHPDWRGVRTVAYSFRTPIVECDDLARWGEDIVSGLVNVGVDSVVVQGWPPGAGAFVRLGGEAGLRMRCVLHSSPAQQGAEQGEAAVVDEVLDLARMGVLAGVGMAKAGVPEAFSAIGHPVTYVPNRIPALPTVEKLDLGPGLHIGVFAEPFWRKNVTTQLLAVGLLEGATAHVLARPDIRYLDEIDIVEHGELPYDQFVALQGSVDVNLYVTLSECHPSTPQESYLMGVPCLLSRTSAVFRSDPDLWMLTTTDEADNPSAIATAAGRLLSNKSQAVERASLWMNLADFDAAERWRMFTSDLDTI
ncbi:MAG: hypothetical protein WBM90_12490 [Acidimicrobiia bacterium]